MSSTTCSPPRRGEEVVRNKPVTPVRERRTLSSFLDRTVAARRHEKPAEGAAGIIPGNRGKEDRNWCGLPLRGASRAQAYVTSSSGRCRSRSSNANMELCGQARTQKPRPSRVRARASFGPCLHAVTQRVTAATARPGRSDLFGRGRTLHKARLAQLAGRARDRSMRGAARDRQKPASLPSLGRREKRVTQLQVERSLRGKRSDPSHGANAPPQAVAVPVVKVPVRIGFL